MNGDVVVVDYGMGNLRSVVKALKHLGVGARLTNDPGDITRAEALVVPGVGAFRDCMANLRRLGLADRITEAIEDGVPYLGICLGLQILFEESSEFGDTPGLGILEGRVERFPSMGLKVPHIGWNRVWKDRSSDAFAGIEEGSYFYFVHSYYVIPQKEEVVIGRTDYGISFASCIERANVLACQFHPEKSHNAGLRFLRNFLQKVSGRRC